MCIPSPPPPPRILFHQARTESSGLGGGALTVQPFGGVFGVSNYGIRKEKEQCRRRVGITNLLSGTHHQLTEGCSLFSPAFFGWMARLCPINILNWPHGNKIVMSVTFWYLDYHRIVITCAFLFIAACLFLVFRWLFSVRLPKSILCLWYIVGPCLAGSFTHTVQLIGGFWGPGMCHLYLI